MGRNLTMLHLLLRRFNYANKQIFFPLKQQNPESFGMCCINKKLTEMSLPVISCFNRLKPNIPLIFLKWKRLSYLGQYCERRIHKRGKNDERETINLKETSTSSDISEITTSVYLPLCNSTRPMRVGEWFFEI